jgi:hypothetical protein
MKSCAKQFSLIVGILIFACSPKFVDAALGTDELCEKVHTEYLSKAQQALAENKLQEALGFLREAKAVAKQCAELLEKPLPEKHIREGGDTVA